MFSIFLLPLSVNAVLPLNNNSFVACYSLDNSDLSGATVISECGNSSMNGDLDTASWTTGKGTIINTGYNGTDSAGNGVIINTTGPIDKFFKNEYSVNFCTKGADSTPTTANKFWGKRDNEDGGHHVEFDAGGGQVEFCAFDATLCLGSSTTINNDVVHMVTAQVNFTGATKTMSIWIDAVQEGVQNVPTVSADTEDKLRFGTNQDARASPLMLLDEIWFRNLSYRKDEIVRIWNSGACTDFADLPGGVSDVSPLNITLINLTSDESASGKGKVIYNNSLEQLNMSGAVRTNDTTPTFRANLSESGTCAILDHASNFNYTDANAYNSGSDCSGAGTALQTCTLPANNETNRTGVHEFSITCKDTTGNQNQTSTFGTFFINITSPNAPNSTLFRPRANEFFTRGVNDTAVNFTYFGLIENKRIWDGNWTVELMIDGAIQKTNTSYANATNASYILDLSSFALGDHNFSVRMTDSYNNINNSENRTFQIRQVEFVNLTLDGVNDTRKYEFSSWANLTAKCQESLGATCSVCITITNLADNNTVACGNTETHYIFNITSLSIINFSNKLGLTSSSHVLTAPGGRVNITSNNLTIILNVSINATSSGESTNLNITFGSLSRKFKGTLKTKFLEDNEFLESNAYKLAVNFTYSTGGSKFIYSNLTYIDNPINITLDISGFDLDLDNQFTYVEHFNDSAGSKGFNQTKSFKTDAPLGYFDDFSNNLSGRWSITDAVIRNSVNDGGDKVLNFEGNPGGSPTLDYTDSAADFRNTSEISP